MRDVLAFLDNIKKSVYVKCLDLFEEYKFKI